MITLQHVTSGNNWQNKKERTRKENDSRQAIQLRISFKKRANCALTQKMMLHNFKRIVLKL
jgi:hypothetical protein